MRTAYILLLQFRGPGEGGYKFSPGVATFAGGTPMLFPNMRSANAAGGRLVAQENNGIIGYKSHVINLDGAIEPTI
jgi:hypothetical protein